MAGEKVQWFGPGETARRLGVSTKALRVSIGRTACRQGSGAEITRLKG